MLRRRTWCPALGGEVDCPSTAQVPLRTPHSVLVGRRSRVAADRQRTARRLETARSAPPRQREAAEATRVLQAQPGERLHPPGLGDDVLQQRLTRSALRLRAARGPHRLNLGVPRVQPFQRPARPRSPAQSMTDQNMTPGSRSVSRCRACLLRRRDRQRPRACSGDRDAAGPCSGRSTTISTGQRRTRAGPRPAAQRRRRPGAPGYLPGSRPARSRAGRGASRRGRE